MTTDEEKQATRALQAWFESQEISPPDAAVVMVMLMAELLVQKSKDLDNLQGSIATMSALLAVEITGHLR